MNGTQAAAASNTQQNDFTQTSKSLSQSKQYVESHMDSTLINKKIEECIQYIVYCTLAEKRAVVKRADINKNIFYIFISILSNFLSINTFFFKYGVDRNFQNFIYLKTKFIKLI